MKKSGFYSDYGFGELSAEKCFTYDEVFINKAENAWQQFIIFKNSSENIYTLYRSGGDWYTIGFELDKETFDDVKKYDDSDIFDNFNSLDDVFNLEFEKISDNQPKKIFYETSGESWGQPTNSSTIFKFYTKTKRFVIINYQADDYNQFFAIAYNRASDNYEEYNKDEVIFQEGEKSMATLYYL